MWFSSSSLTSSVEGEILSPEIESRRCCHHLTENHQIVHVFARYCEWVRIQAPQNVGMMVLMVGLDQYWRPSQNSCEPELEARRCCPYSAFGEGGWYVMGGWKPLVNAQQMKFYFIHLKTLDIGVQHHRNGHMNAQHYRNGHTNACHECSAS
jgi:hypothetical protein